MHPGRLPRPGLNFGGSRVVPGKIPHRSRTRHRPDRRAPQFCGTHPLARPAPWRHLRQAGKLHLLFPPRHQHHHLPGTILHPLALPEMIQETLLSNPPFFTTFSFSLGARKTGEYKIRPYWLNLLCRGEPCVRPFPALICIPLGHHCNRKKQLRLTEPFHRGDSPKPRDGRRAQGALAPSSTILPPFERRNRWPRQTTRLPKSESAQTPKASASRIGKSQSQRGNSRSCRKARL